MNQITIAVIGGTGKSGKYVVEQLLLQHFQLRLLVRNPENVRFQDDRITICPGDVRDPAAVRSLLDGCQVVVSTLGQPKGEPSVFSAATRTILEAIQATNIQRYIITTGLHVDTPLDLKNEQVRAATEWMHAQYPETTIDKQKEYELLTQSTVDWTLIRLPIILETQAQFGGISDVTDCAGNSISASDLGAFIAAEIVAKNYVRQAPFLYNK